MKDLYVCLLGERKFTPMPAEFILFTLNFFKKRMPVDVLQESSQKILQRHKLHLMKGGRSWVGVCTGH